MASIACAISSHYPETHPGNYDGARHGSDGPSPDLLPTLDLPGKQPSGLVDPPPRPGAAAPRASSGLRTAREALSLQRLPFEAMNQTEERDYFPLKARQLAADWEVRQRKTKLEKHAARSLRILSKCEGYCRELRQVLRQQEDL